MIKMEFTDNAKRAKSIIYIRPEHITHFSLEERVINVAPEGEPVVDRLVHILIVNMDTMTKIYEEVKVPKINRGKKEFYLEVQKIEKPIQYIFYDDTIGDVLKQLEEQVLGVVFGPEDVTLPEPIINVVPETVVEDTFDSLPL